MAENVRILCVDDEANVLKALQRLFMDEDYEIETAESGETGIAAMEQQEAQVIISDYRMPGMNGVEFLKQVYERWPDTVRIVLSGYADTASVVEAINEGQIYKFIPKPWNDDELKITIDKAIETYFLRKKNLELSKELQDSNEELTKLNENLEELVEERTEEVIFQNKVLARSQYILDSLPVAVLGIDISGCIVQCNRYFQELMQEENISLLGENISHLPPVIQNIIEKGSSKSPQTITIAGQHYLAFKATMGDHKAPQGEIVVLTPIP
ncbi:MAG: response regulator [Proteobacteria bacterium]|nr:response regulator [Pseudomonadota bacterium]MBU1715361.1 response regulator [Pseudomonadota bacterium]